MRCPRLWSQLTALLLAIRPTYACTVCTNESPEPITSELPPWTLKGTIYSFFLLPGLGIPLDSKLPRKAFPPFERQYPASIAGDYQGTLGMIQVIRYTESPVCPYDEFLMNGLTIAAVTKNNGNFGNADEVAKETIFGPGLIEID